jgi:hypothetical protein
METLKDYPRTLSLKPCITVVRSRDELDTFSIARPTTNTNKGPIRVKGDANIDFTSKKELKVSDSLFEGDILHLYPDRDDVLPTIPIPVTIRPGPETIVSPYKPTKKIEYYFSNKLRDRPQSDIWETGVNKNDTTLLPISFIELSTIDRIRLTYVPHDITDKEPLTKKDYLRASLIPGMVVGMFDWVLDAHLIYYLYRVFTSKNLLNFQYVKEFCNTVGPIFDTSRIYETINHLSEMISYGKIVTPGSHDFWGGFLVAANYFTLGLGLFVSIGAFKDRKKVVVEKKGLYKIGEGVMGMKVGCAERLPSKEKMEGTVKVYKPGYSDKSVEEWGKGTRYK